jgi:hypothetical protein
MRRIKLFQLWRGQHRLVFDSALRFVQERSATVDAAMKLAGPSSNVDDTCGLNAQRSVSSINFDRYPSGSSLALIQRRNNKVLPLLVHRPLQPIRDRHLPLLLSIDQ